MNVQTSAPSKLTVSWNWDRVRNRIITPTFSHLVMLSVLVLLLFPMFYAFLIATQTPSQYYEFPPRFIPGSSFLENVRIAWERINLGRLVFNTSVVAISVAIGKIVLSVTAAFAFVYFDFKGKAVFFVTILITHMLPLPVRIVPTFELIDQLEWINTFRGLTIPFFASATGVLLFRQLYRTIPPSLADAARIDGAGPLQFLWSVVIPLSKTNMAALFLIEFIYMWNQYLWPLIIANAERTRVVQIGLKQLVDTDAAVDWHIVMAGALIATLPPLLLLIIMQRSLIEGMSLYEEK
ncbi:MAG: ABC transporter permease subunit [Chloroflexi bacterium]|nr:ABC transporter permease subunit [Chloroflexota bacterium]